MRRFLTQSEQFSWRVGMKRVRRMEPPKPQEPEEVPRSQFYYHTTDAELNPGDEVLSAQERGHTSRWEGTMNYDPSRVYLYDENADPEEYSHLGKYRYQVEPVGDIRRDPEREWNQIWRDLRLHDRSKGWNQHAYTAPRARVVKKIEV